MTARTYTLCGDQTAIISECGRYRYELRRIWDEKLPPYLSIMLNPSTADHERDDPTIRRNINRAQALGFGSLIVCNLGAGRATNPRDWMAMRDPIGPENDHFIESALCETRDRKGVAVAGWGTLGDFMRRDLAVKTMARRLSVDLYSLGVTFGGHPKHPLYVPRRQDLTMFFRHEQPRRIGIGQ